MSWSSTKTNLVTNFLNPKLDEVIYVCKNLAQYIEKNLMRLSAVSAKSLTTLKYLPIYFLQHGYYKSIFSPSSGSFLKVDQKLL